MSEKPPPRHLDIGFTLAIPKDRLSQNQVTSDIAICTHTHHPATMATRRIISSEKTILDQDDHDGSSPAADQKSNISPAVPT